MNLRIVRKIISRLRRSIIKKYDYVNTDIYMKKYVKWLASNGMDISKEVKYISPDAYFDGYDYSKIHVGSNVTISMQVMLLTHDFSLTTALATQEKRIKRHDGEYYKISDIYIGNDTFIGARASILPGTKIGNNVIVGACTVVKGAIPNNSIVIGNPCKIIAQTDEYAKKLMLEKDYLIEG